MVVFGGFGSVRSVVILSGVVCILVMVGCVSEDTDEQPSGACGEVTEHVVAVRAKVLDSEASPVIGALVEVQDRGWDPGTVLGSGLTNASGEVHLVDLNVTSVEDCWGTLLDYYVVATLDDRTAEKQVNSALFSAIDGGTLEADLRSTPIELP
ncbi:MAG: hypothetical protein ACI9MC_002255 [Kiritimatiellia bacterium]|jgi:hypothetical protein